MQLRKREILNRYKNIKGVLFMNQEIEEIYNKRFEDIKHIDENGLEYWNARELQIVLDLKNGENLKM